MNLKNNLPMDDQHDEGLLTPELQSFKDHIELTDRLRKTLYYGKLPTNERPSLALTGISVEIFSKVLPNDGLKVLDMHYAASVSRRACITPCSMMLAMVYLDQLRHKNPQYLLKVSSCDLFLVSMMVASKFLYDNGEEDEVFNDEWAASANIEVKDLNQLELDFLDAIDWNLLVKPRDFTKVLNRIERRIAQLESTQRGWTSYTDLSVLTDENSLSQCWLTILDGVIKVIVVSAVAYVAATLTLIGAVALVHRLSVTSHAFLHRTLDLATPPVTRSTSPGNVTCKSPLVSIPSSDSFDGQLVQEATRICFNPEELSGSTVLSFPTHHLPSRVTTKPPSDRSRYRGIPIQTRLEHMETHHSNDKKQPPPVPCNRMLCSKEMGQGLVSLCVGCAELISTF